MSNKGDYSYVQVDDGWEGNDAHGRIETYIGDKPPVSQIQPLFESLSLSPRYFTNVDRLHSAGYGSPIGGVVVTDPIRRPSSQVYLEVTCGHCNQSERFAGVSDCDFRPKGYAAVRITHDKGWYQQLLCPTCAKLMHEAGWFDLQ